MKSEEPVSYNRKAWDNLASKNNEWTVPVSAETIAEARQGDWQIVLTPEKPVPRSWLGSVSGADILCLAGGGGQQAPILSAAGGRVTTLDNSSEQLARDRLVAEREGLEIRTVLGQMDDLSEFADQSFDLVVHPCSNCFAPRIRPVWQEAFRVLRPGGELLSGFANPVRYLFDPFQMQQGHLVVKHQIPYSDLRDLPDEDRQKLIDANEPMEFGHTLTDQIGGQIDAGFVISGLYEDNWQIQEEPLSPYLDSFMATRATRPDSLT
ncbi:MAG: class I SAM-dependent methyltransferase [Mariniblastus sp.]|nr:class I SAM-dependent methyltransferase [Mariniblastus sp.]